MPKRVPLTDHKSKLIDAQAGVDRADEVLAVATAKRDRAVYMASTEGGMSLAEIGRVLGVRRETAHYAKLRASARLGEEVAV